MPLPQESIAFVLSTTLCNGRNAVRDVVIDTAMVIVKRIRAGANETEQLFTRIIFRCQYHPLLLKDDSFARFETSRSHLTILVCTLDFFLECFQCGVIVNNQVKVIVV